MSRTTPPDHAVAPEATTLRSTSVTSTLREASSKNVAAPTMPPPATMTSTRSDRARPLPRGGAASREQRLEDLARAHGRVRQQRRRQAVRLLAGALHVDRAGDEGGGLDAV